MDKVYVIQYEKFDEEYTTEVLKRCYADKALAMAAMLKAAKEEKKEYAEKYPYVVVTKDDDSCDISASKDDRECVVHVCWTIVEVSVDTGAKDEKYLREMIRQESLALYSAVNKDMDDDALKAMKSRLDELFNALYGKGV